MAKATRHQPKPSFYEIVMEGSPKMVRGFMSGLLLGEGRGGTIFYNYEEGVYEESLPEKLAERLHLHPRNINFIVDGATRTLLQKLAKHIEQETGLRIVASRYIRSAEFPFCFKAYARRYGVEILGKLNNLPAGLRLEDFATEEEIHPEAAGIEAYAPVHDYEIEGKGKQVGRIDLLIAARHELDAHPLVEVGSIQLKLA